MYFMKLSTRDKTPHLLLVTRTQLPPPSKEEEDNSLVCHLILDLHDKLNLEVKVTKAYLETMTCTEGKTMVLTPTVKLEDTTFSSTLALRALPSEAEVKDEDMEILGEEEDTDTETIQEETIRTTAIVTETMVELEEAMTTTTLTLTTQRV